MGAVLIMHTFTNEKQNHFSVIDFICVSNTLLNHVHKYEVINDETNHSDHLPVTVLLDLPVQSVLYKSIVSGYVASKSPSPSQVNGTK